MRARWPFGGRPVAEVPAPDDLTVLNVRVNVGLEPVLADVHLLTSFGRVLLRDCALVDPEAKPRVIGPWVWRVAPPEAKPSAGYVSAYELPAAIRHRVADALLEAWRKRGG